MLACGLAAATAHADEPRLDDSASTARVKRSAAASTVGPLRRQLEAWADRDLAPVAIDGTDLPRFSTHVLVEAPAPASLQRFFEGFDTSHGPTFASAPNHQEMWREMSPRQAATPFDLLGLAKSLVDLFRKDGPPRFFLYQASDATHAWLLLREGDLPAATRYGSPGISFQALGAFPSLKAAQAAYERLEDALGERVRREQARGPAAEPGSVGPPAPAHPGYRDALAADEPTRGLEIAPPQP